MNKQSGFSGLLAAAASFLVIGMVAVGSASPAAAQSEEDLAAPPGSFVSTMAVPPDVAGPVRDGEVHPVLILSASEEDAAVPQGSFTSTMVAPEVGSRNVRVSAAK